MQFSSTALARMQQPSMLCDAQHAHNRAWQWKIFCQQPCHKPEIACNVIGLHLVWRTRFTIATWNNSSPPIWYWLQYKAKKNKFCLKTATRICFSVHVWFSKIQAFWFFFCLLIFFFSFLCLWISLSKYTWRYMTDTVKHFEQQISSTLCFVYLFHPKIKFLILFWTKLWLTQIWHVCCSEKKKKKKC